MDSAGGDAGGAGGDVGGVSGDEAAWRELIERFDLPYDADQAHPPWPDSENVADEPPRLPRRGEGPPWPDAPPPGPGGGSPGGGSAGGGRAGGSPAGPAAGERTGQDRPRPRPAGPDQSGLGHGKQSHGEQGHGEQGHGEQGHGEQGHGEQGQGGPGHDGPGAGGPVTGRARIVRPAAPPHIQPATDLPGAGRGGQHRAAEQGGALDDDGRYIPPQPPPLPKLSPAAKGAWAALFGGPAYLLIATLIGWQIPDWAALVAVAAFVGGFTAVILRMEDRPPRDDHGDDNGAVV